MIWEEQQVLPARQARKTLQTYWTLKNTASAGERERKSYDVPITGIMFI